jgi:hypothetical protein
LVQDLDGLAARCASSSAKSPTLRADHSQRSAGDKAHDGLKQKQKFACRHW